MDSIPRVLADLREREDDAVVATDRATAVSTRELARSAWQMGNLFRHYGVRPGDRVALVAGPTTPVESDDPGRLGDSPVPVLAALGALAAGGVLDLDPPGAVDATALVVPAAWVDRYRPGPGTTVMAYGGEPDAADVIHLEREAWSENPTAPPVDLDPTTAAVADDRTYAHGDVVAMARGVVHDEDLAGVAAVGLDAPLTDAATLAAGVVAPLLADVPISLDDAAASVTVTRARDVERGIDPSTVG